MKIIIDLYKHYGHGVVERATPGPDGLFPVERRVLTGVWKIARNKFMKSAKVVGEVFGSWHPHSPESIYQTMVKLVRNGLIHGQGNFGKIALKDAPPAAMRYTEVKCVDWLAEIAFSMIKFVKWVEIEGTEAEPHVLPSPIPLFIGSGTSDGISYWKFTALQYDYKELVKAMIGLINGKEYIPKPNMLNCKILSGSIEEYWKTGKAKFVIQSNYKQHKDGIDIIGKIQNINVNKWDKANISYSDLSHSNKLCVRLYKRRGINLEKYVPSWNVTTSLLMYYNDNIYVDIGLRDLMLFQYNNVFLKALDAKIKHDIKVLEDKKLDLICLKHVKALLKDHPRLSSDKIVSLLPDNLKERGKKIVSKYSVKQLIDVDLNEIENELKIARAKNAEKEGFKFLEQFI